MHPLMPLDRRVLARVRKIVLGWPAAHEAIKWGRPHFMAGKKLFANVGPTHERPSIGPFDWDEVADYLRLGYRLVAQQRMLAAMDAMETTTTRSTR